MDYPEVLICQYCGRVTSDSEKSRATWLVAPHRRRNLWVIRCPHHISEWAMRLSTGRTQAMRDRAERGRTMRLPPVSAMDPIPSRFKGAKQ